MHELYIGLMSGTSLDGIDAVLVDLAKNKPNILFTHFTTYSNPLREKILSLCHPSENEINQLGELDILLGRAFAQAAKEVLAQSPYQASDIKAIGSHGQTIRHHPNQNPPFTLQLGDPNTIAARTQITTIADFRRKDMAHQGQGAPLVPAFHQAVFQQKGMNRAIVNIGGIANITLLPGNAGADITGFDTGPGNTLMDSWIAKHKQLTHDQDGTWAKSGNINQALLEILLSEPYFQQTPPKSTGRELFNLNWLNHHLSQINGELKAEDVQATLVELTAISIINGIQNTFKQGEIYICGGGAHNHYLLQRLTTLAQSQFILTTTQDLNIHPDWVEATAFAWLAKQTFNRLPGNVPKITGAHKACVLGGIYYA